MHSKSTIVFLSGRGGHFHFERKGTHAHKFCYGTFNVKLSQRIESDGGGVEDYPRKINDINSGTFSFVIEYLTLHEQSGAWTELIVDTKKELRKYKDGLRLQRLLSSSNNQP